MTGDIRADSGADLLDTIERALRLWPDTKFEELRALERRSPEWLAALVTEVRTLQERVRRAEQESWEYEEFAHAAEADYQRLRGILAKCEVQLRGRGPVADILATEIREAVITNRPDTEISEIHTTDSVVEDISRQQMGSPAPSPTPQEEK